MDKCLKREVMNLSEIVKENEKELHNYIKEIQQQKLDTITTLNLQNRYLYIIYIIYILYVLYIYIYIYIHYFSLNMKRNKYDGN